uniref:F-box protein 39 n=1 Tax=Lepisosteus oculatus TaxID=7918 RepID=W5MIG8_LEPOC|nr:PREDICTED: F-box only protein 39 [Lepisosteus oculatus]
MDPFPADDLLLTSECETTEEEEDGQLDEQEEEEEQETVGWGLLPEVCLRRVFSFLQDCDRARAALVCRHWLRVLHAPELWRARSFVFSGRAAKSRRADFQSAVCYAKTFGRHLETLEIRFTNPVNSLTSRRFQQTLRTFLAVLRKDNSRLKSLSICCMELDRPAWSRSVRNALVKSLSIFLRKAGHRLDNLNLRGARLGPLQGCELLESIAHQSGKSALSKLNIEDFFPQATAVYTLPAFAHALARFRNLSVLSLSYSCVSDSLLEALAAGCARTLGALHVRCHALEPHGQVVWGVAWARLVQGCPRLRVNFSIERILHADRLLRILLPEIPVRSLGLSTCYFSEQDWTVKPVLTEVLPLFKDCLQKLILDFNNSHESVDDELLQLILQCSKLSYLKVWAFLDVRFIETLLQHRLEGKCSLKTIKIRIYTNRYDTHEEDHLLEEFFTKYKELIEKELSYFVISYPML